jgi:phage antirepressor YoqD-like protein
MIRLAAEIDVTRRYLAALQREQASSGERKIVRPITAIWEVCGNADGLIGMAELADILNVSVQRLSAWLLEEKLFRKYPCQGGRSRSLPLKRSQDAGYFVVKIEHRNGRTLPVAYATPRGVRLVIDRWERDNA